jgi:hypothetical protein
MRGIGRRCRQKRKKLVLSGILRPAPVVYSGGAKDKTSVYIVNKKKA